MLEGIYDAFDKMSKMKANDLVSQSIAAAKNILQGYREMAGVAPDQPLRTMARENQDLNHALTKVNAYTTATGKIPSYDFLATEGLQGTLGPVADQDTLETQMAKEQMAMKWLAAQGGGAGGGSKSGGNENAAGLAYLDLIKPLEDASSSFRYQWMQGGTPQAPSYSAVKDYNDLRNKYVAAGLPTSVLTDAEAYINKLEQSDREFIASEVNKAQRNANAEANAKAAQAEQTKKSIGGK